MVWSRASDDGVPAAPVDSGGCELNLRQSYGKNLGRIEATAHKAACRT